VAKTSGIPYKRQGREFALQFLFQHDIIKLDFNEEFLSSFWAQLRYSQVLEENRDFRRAKKFAEECIRGVIENREEVDAAIAHYAKDGWPISRMAVADRNILRIAIYEMLCCPDIPPVVSINEAIEVARAFCDSNARPFINGILNSVKDNLKRPPREAAKVSDD